MRFQRCLMRGTAAMSLLEDLFKPGQTAANAASRHAGKTAATAMDSKSDAGLHECGPKSIRQLIMQDAEVVGAAARGRFPDPTSNWRHRRKSIWSDDGQNGRPLLRRWISELAVREGRMR